MPTNPSDRLRWAVDALAVQPDDHLLEIGCGHGVAVSLVCEKLVGGHITAIDRSPKMVEMARARNTPCIAAGKASIKRAELRDADLGGQTFDKVFAIHVNLFWQKPEQAFAIVRRLVAPGGAFSLLFQPLARDPSAVQDLTKKALTSFEANGFAIGDAKTEDITGGPMVCLTGRLE